MSVIASKRQESHVQFITTAGDLLKFTTQTCLKFPKRITFFISTDLVKTSQDIYRDLIYANSLYLFTQEHAVKRKELFEKALGYLEYLSSMLNVAMVYVPGTKPSVWTKWTELIGREKQLIKNVIASDTKRTIQNK